MPSTKIQTLSHHAGHLPTRCVLPSIAHHVILEPSQLYFPDPFAFWPLVSLGHWKVSWRTEWQVPPLCFWKTFWLTWWLPAPPSLVALTTATTVALGSCRGLSGPDSLGSAMAAAGHPSLRHLLLLFPLLIFPFSLFWPFQHFYNWPPAFNALFAIPNEVSVFSKRALNDTAFGIRNPAPLMGVKAGLADLMRLESSEGGPHPQGTVGSAFGP